MTELVNVYVQDVPAMRFIGKTYGEKDFVNGSFGHLWGTWFHLGWFEPLEALVTAEFREKYSDWDAYLGLMSMGKGEDFAYRIGLFAPAGTPAPEGYEALDFPAGKWGVGWLKGTEPELYGREELVMKALHEQGNELVPDAQGRTWFAERYGCPRFTTPAEDGSKILDIICWLG